jgi:peroxiredoxin
LNFSLGSDTNFEVCRKYDTLWLGIRVKRQTFLIDKQGIIRGKFSHEVLVDRHRENVLKLLKEMEHP